MSIHLPMRRLLHVAFAVSSGVTFSLYAQPTLLGTGAASAPTPTIGGVAARGFLWEARKGDRRIDLIGTVHVGRPAFYPPPPELQARIDQAAVIAVEADVFNAQKVAPIIEHTAYFAEREAGLEQRLPEPLRTRVAALLPRYGLDPARAWRMKPWMLANTLVILDAIRAGFNPAYATEAYLYAQAQRGGKTIAEVESVDFQLRLFDSATPELQAAFLEQSVGSIESGDAGREVEELVSAWVNGDADAIEQLYATLRGESAAEHFVLEQLLEGRNPGMADAIERFAASGQRTLVAVGTLHYFGPRGLLVLLRGRGWSVNRL
jgi:uncharacterized protein YbaP (TraB family)